MCVSVCWLIGWFLWHINFCGLFNAKPFFIYTWFVSEYFVENFIFKRVVIGATNPGRCEPRSNGNEWAVHIPQCSRTGTSPSGGLVSYSGHSLIGRGREESYRSVNSTTLADGVCAFLCVVLWMLRFTDWQFHACVYAIRRRQKQT